MGLVGVAQIRRDLGQRALRLAEQPLADVEACLVEDPPPGRSLLGQAPSQRARAELCDLGRHLQRRAARGKQTRDGLSEGTGEMPSASGSAGPSTPSVLSGQQLLRSSSS